jgi:hypothetical protein
MRILAAILLLTAGAWAETKLGKPLSSKQTIAIEELLAKPQSYVGKNVQVRGKVTEVCQMAGCWMMLTDDNGKAVRIKVRDGDIVFPKDSIGRQAVAEGKFTKMELTRADAVARAKHDADEQGKKFDEASITGPATIYQIQGSGAVILD